MLIGRGEIQSCICGKVSPKAVKLSKEAAALQIEDGFPVPSDKEMIEGTLSKLIFSYELLQ